MAKEKGLWFEEDLDCCMNCGQSPYQHSRTNGLCLDCNPSDSRYTGLDDISPDEGYSSSSNSI